MPCETEKKRKKKKKQPKLLQEYALPILKTHFWFQKRQLQHACLGLPNDRQAYVLNINMRICEGNYFNYLVTLATP